MPDAAFKTIILIVNSTATCASLTHDSKFYIDFELHPPLENRGGQLQFGLQGQENHRWPNLRTEKSITNFTQIKIAALKDKEKQNALN